MNRKYKFLLFLILNISFLFSQVNGIQIDTVLCDAQVNDFEGTGRQFNPSIAISGDASYVITWIDERNGNNDIYAQRFDSLGNAIGTNILVNDDGINCNNIGSSIAMSNDGQFIIIWIDNRTGDYNIYLQRFDNLGNPIDSNMLINDYEGNNSQFLPEIAMSNDGYSVVTWSDNRNGTYNIYAQRFDNSGATIGNNINITGNTKHSYPIMSAVAMAEDKSYVIVWEEDRDISHDDWNIYAQRFDSLGNAIGTNIIVNDDSGNEGQGIPSIAMTDKGVYVISWIDDRNNNKDIFAQRFDAFGNTLGENFIVDENPYINDNPTISISNSGTFVIIWQDSYTGIDIYAQRFDALGNAIGSNKQINDDIQYNTYKYPCIDMSEDGSYVIAWEDNRNDEEDIYAQRFNAQGNAIGTNTLINDDIKSSYQTNPMIVLANDLSYIICWEDRRNGNFDIYYQRYDTQGNAIDLNTHIIDDKNSQQKFPAIAMANNKSYIITWSDSRNGNYDIYAQRFDASGNAIGSNILINDDGENSTQTQPAIGITRNGSYIITWSDNRNGNYDIYAQHFDSLGNAIGTNILVNDDGGDKDQSMSSIAITNYNSYVITWSDYRNNDWDIYAQHFDAMGNTNGSNFIVNDNIDSLQVCSKIAILSEGHYIITWSDNRNGNHDIYAQRFDEANNPIGPNIIINDSLVSINETNTPNISVATDDSYIITWIDSKDDNHTDIYAQIYNASGYAIGNNFTINSTYSSNRSNATSPSVKIADSKIFTTWDEVRNPENYYDIYYNILEYSSILPMASTVYPGDTNNDGIVDALDILPIGVYFLEEGTSRTDASNIWEGQDVASWPSYPANYADCNGDGTVDEKDIIGVGVNWGSSRTNSINKFMINQNDKQMLAKHKEAFETIYNSVDGLESAPAKAIRQLLETTLEIIPNTVTLYQCHPNPYNPSTEISFSLPEAMSVSLKVFDINGRHMTTLVKDTELESGYHNITFNGEAYPSGMYIYVLETENSINAQKMMLIK